MRRIWIATPLALLGVLLAATGCDSSPGVPTADPTDSAVLGSAGPPDPTGSTPDTPPPGPGTTTTAPAADWPPASDCISYNPATITAHYEAGIWTVNNGSTEILRVYGGPSDNAGQKALAVAKRYRRLCYIGRANTREDKQEYIFEYWRDPSGISTTVPDSEDDCSPYNRNNLTVEDMGSGQGWRVKEHDHVLQLFDNETDARNGKIVLAKYGQICTVVSYHDDAPEAITYS